MCHGGFGAATPSGMVMTAWGLEIIWPVDKVLSWLAKMPGTLEE